MLHIVLLNLRSNCSDQEHTPHLQPHSGFNLCGHLSVSLDLQLDLQRYRLMLLTLCIDLGPLLSPRSKAFVPGWNMRDFH